MASRPKYSGPISHKMFQLSFAGDLLPFFSHKQLHFCSCPLVPATPAIVCVLILSPDIFYLWSTHEGYVPIFIFTGTAFVSFICVRFSRILHTLSVKCWGGGFYPLIYWAIYEYVFWIGACSWISRI